MSDVAVATPVAMRAEPPRTLPMRDFKISEYEYARFSARLGVGVTIEDALKPEFWVHVVHLLAKAPVTGEPDKAGAVIEIRTVDHSFYAELYVRAVQDRGLLVSVLREPVYFGPKEVSTAQFETRWNVGKRGFDVLRKSDREIVAGGLPTREAAAEWIEKTMKVH